MKGQPHSAGATTRLRPSDRARDIFVPNELVLRGWALSPVGISGVLVHIDDRLLHASYDSTRRGSPESMSNVPHPAERASSSSRACRQRPCRFKRRPKCESGGCRRSLYMRADPRGAGFAETGVRIALTDGEVSRLAAAWREAVLDHPGQYLQGRLGLWTRQIGIGHTSLYTRAAPQVPTDPPEEAAAFPSLSAAATDYAAL